MPFSDLLGKPPIMDLIIYYLTPIPPKASSGITRQEYFGKDKEEYERLPDESDPGMISRNGIRSDSLAKLMRVNISFNHYVSPFLYRDVICDDLPSLLYKSRRPSAHPLITSKDENLRYCRRLHLEYCRKTDDVDYSLIMSDTGYFQTIASATPLSRAIGVGRSEAVRIFLSLDDLAPHTKPAFPSPFPRLHHVSVGAIFGGHYNLWNSIVMSKAKMVNYVSKSRVRPSDKTMESFGPFPNWRGPKSAPTPVTNPLFTMHVPPDRYMHPSAVGQRTRWVLDEDYHRRIHSVNAYQVASSFDNQLKRLAEIRETEKDAEPFQIEIYGSGVPTAEQASRNGVSQDPAGERALLLKLREVLKGNREKKGMGPSQDLVSWGPTMDCPPCEACGWEYGMEELQLGGEEVEKKERFAEV